MLKPTERIIFTQKNRKGTTYSTEHIDHMHQLIDSSIVDISSNTLVRELNYEETMAFLGELMKPKSSYEVIAYYDGIYPVLVERAESLDVAKAIKYDAHDRFETVKIFCEGVEVKQ